jgi:hypothetical protein
MNLSCRSADLASPVDRTSLADFGRPADLAKRTAKLFADRKSMRADTFQRDSFALPRAAAHAKASEMLQQFPEAADRTEIESWRVLPDDRIEFVVRRLPGVD